MTGLENILAGEVNGITLFLSGVTVVFSGLLFVALMVYLLPKIIYLRFKPEPQKSMPILKKEDPALALLAIAVAYHFELQKRDEPMKVTFKKSWPFESTWKMSHRALNLRGGR